MSLKPDFPNKFRESNIGARGSDLLNRRRMNREVRENSKGMPEELGIVDRPFVQSGVITDGEISVVVGVEVVDERSERAGGNMVW